MPGQVSSNIRTLLGWSDVRAFGATGDGATDDTDAIQGALDAAGAGGVVALPPGNYLVDYLTIPWDGLTLFGFGGATITKAIGATKISVIEAANKVGLTLRDFTIDGQGQLQSWWNPDAYSNTTESDNIRLTYCDRARIIDVRSRASARAGVQLYGCTNALLQGVSGEDNGFGTIALYRLNAADFSSLSCVGTRVVACRANHDYCDGIRVICDGVTVTGCSSTNARNGLALGAPDNYAGFYVESARGVTLTGNYSIGNSLRGMDMNWLVGDYTHGTFDCVAVGNVIFDHPSGGILGGTARCIVVGNVCYNNGTFDVDISHGTGNVAVGNTGG